MKLLPSLILLSLLAGCGASAPPPPALILQVQQTDAAAGRASQNGHWRNAARLWQEAARQHAALDDAAGVAKARLGEAQAWIGLNKPDDARQLLRTMASQPTTPTHWQAEAFYQLALLDFKQQAWDSGLSLLAQAEAISDAKHPLRAAIANGRARVAEAQGDWAAVSRYSNEALQHPALEPLERINALRLQGLALLEQGEMTKAAALLDQALQQAQALARPASIAATLHAHMLLSQKRGDGLAVQWQQRWLAVCEAAALVCGKVAAAGSEAAGR